MSRRYSISEAAREAGLTSHQVRNYLQFHLVESCRRTPGGRHQFDEACVRRLRLISAAMRTGLLIENLRPFLDELDQGNSAALEEHRVSILRLIRARQNAIDQLAGELQNACGNPKLYCSEGA